jgi:hypothetical protein
MQQTILELRQAMKLVREEIQKIRREKAARMGYISQPATPKSSHKSQRLPKEDSREMTFEEKRILSENINKLPAEGLGKIVQIIHSRMPHLAQNSPEEIEIDIDALDARTLRALERYVKTALRQSKNYLHVIHV